MTDLLAKKQILSCMINIPDMRWYAAAWLMLADEFLSIGAIHNADDCRSRGKHYSTFLAGEYVRLVDGCFAEMIHVP